MKEHKIARADHKAIINRIKFTIIALICIVLCVLQLFSLIKREEYDKYTLTKNVVVKHKDKKIFEGNIDDFVMEGIESEDKLSMHMSIPKNNLVSPAIQYDNINTAVKVYVDKQEVYSIGEDTPKGGIVCHAFNKAPLGDITNKKEIVMSIRVMNNSTLVRLPRVYMMNTYDIDTDYYYSMHIYMLIGYYFGIIGFLGLILVSFLWKKDIIMYKMLVLAITCIECLLYMISMFQVIPLFSDSYVIDAYIEYSCRVYLPMLLNLYMCLNYPKGKRKLSILLTIISGAHATIAIILQVLKVMYLNDTIAFNLFMYVCAGINIFIYYMKYKKDSFSRRALMRLVGAVLGLVIIYVIVYIFFSNYSDYFLVIVPMAIIVVLTSFYMELITEITSNIITSAKEKALEEIAYMDGLTRIPNRRGFETYLADKLNKNTRYNVYSFDLNKLKYVNDHYGHVMGDEYIKIFAYKLEEVFEDGFCARLGGDEFVAVLDKKYKENEVINNLKKTIHRYNEKSDQEYKLAYSVGVIDYNPKRDDIAEVMKKADEEMYKMKNNEKR